MRQSLRIVLAGGCAAVLAACGGSEVAPPEPGGVPMQPREGPTVQAPERAPVVDRVRLEPPDPVPDGRVRAVVEAHHPDGATLRLRHRWTVDGKPAGNDQAMLVLDGARKGAEVQVEVVAEDGVRESTPVRAWGRVGNRPPRLVAVGLEPQEDVRAGTPVQAVPEASDPDQDDLRYEVVWFVNGVAEEATGLELDTSGLRRGDRVEVELRASDGDVTTSAVRSGVLEIANGAPEITTRPELALDGGVFRYDVDARDPDGDRNLRYALLEAPEGMTIDRLGGEISWTPRPSQVGTHTVEVAAEDGLGAAAVQRFVLTIGTEDGEETQPPAAPTR